MCYYPGQTNYHALLCCFYPYQIEDSVHASALSARREAKDLHVAVNPWALAVVSIQVECNVVELTIIRTYHAAAREECPAHSDIG
jgi:hypothetical protein